MFRTKLLWDTVETTKAPLIASHSGGPALKVNHPRNMTDAMLHAMAKNGGVVMVNFYSVFIDENFRQAYDAQATERKAAVAAAKAAYEQAHPGQDVPHSVTENTLREWGGKIARPPLTSLIDNIDHVAKVAGIEHVGLGSDFDGVEGQLPECMVFAADLPKITQALMERGYTAQQIRKILGENLLRVFRDVERISSALRHEK